ncbi:MAG: DUF5107 domain-containing protein [Clostridia bacterium]|nr:DUF5107 domain-containing protein [Clostridia bacterium]
MIRWEYYTMPAADMGEENPLSDIGSIEYIHAGYEVTENVEPEARENLGKGMINTILPYTIQDQYNRVRKERKFRAAVLENEYLKATFLPELGGRLWSLIDKEKNRELLYVNPVYQPANLAIRNAWFSGGVEFNVGIKGHNMLTCDNMFARIATTKDGEEVLQIYEWERVRGAVFGINAYLPAGSKVLYLKDTVENIGGGDKYTYWWSNIAVPETPGTRVIVPAEKSFLSFYNDGHYVMDKTSIPVRNGVDESYPTHVNRSLDFFYQIPKDSDERWVAAVAEDGVGLVQMSTMEMKGRKLFVWGQGTGGKHWGNWLSDGSGSYIEIQAGLAYTQLEHVPMKAGEKLSWTEGYTSVTCDTDDAFSTDLSRAIGAVSKDLHSKLDKATIDESLRYVVPEEFVSFKVLMNGSGFGALEEISRGSKVSERYDFYTDSLDNKQEQWLTLLKEGYLPEINVTDCPVSYVSGKEWAERLEASLNTEKGNHWYTYYQLGNVYYALGDEDAAIKAFEKSNEMKANPFSLRNLAMLNKKAGNKKLAAQLMLEAIALKPNHIPLTVDCVSCLIGAEMYDKMKEIYEGLTDELKARGRIRLFLALAHMGLGEYYKATEIVNKDFVMDDIREGEVSIAHIWLELYLEIARLENPGKTEEELVKIRDEKYPIPAEVDFRMHE